MQTTDIPQELDSIDWGTPQSHYPARGQAPEIYATRLKNKVLRLLMTLKSCRTA